MNESQFDGLSETMKKHLIDMAEEEQMILDEVCGVGSGSGNTGVIDGSYYDLPWDNYRDRGYVLKVESGNEPC